MKKLVSGVIFLVLACAMTGSAQVEQKVDFDILSAPEKGLNIIYDPSTGQLALEANVPEQRVTTLEMISQEKQLFQGDRPPVYSGIFDLYRPDKAFILDPAGKDFVDNIGNIGPGLSGQEILSEIKFDGAKFLGGGLDSFEGGVHLVVIPEPSTMVLALFGGLLILRRFRHEA